MNEILQTLNRIESRLVAIENMIAKPAINEALCKSVYSCSEISELSQLYGVKSYRPFTVRLACKDRRIPEAEKREDGFWTVPRNAVIRILEQGMPPERRKGSVAPSSSP